MRRKTSISLDDKTLAVIKKLAGKSSNRSRVIEEAVLAFAAQREREARDRRDIELINKNADRLNAEAEDTLGYQVEW